MGLNEYQVRSRKTDRHESDREKLILTSFDLVEEAGGVVEKLKKLIRDKDYVLDDEYSLSIRQGLGNVLWHISRLGGYLGVTLEDVAITNLDKLKKRCENNTINGEGDDR
ncbi:nucleoside triphosphate pyrophosphohydrolase family protein [Borrelia sp. BU AG58]|uniref:nucleoside triphosphate pyrophosphohydrolase family protein n=1 Tax=Borrelia sp. BU AG58 TaxID=2887345 RepID=UPI0027D20262|nr:nucleoside triphosphate pyrophosphohydrolase family protein [Borrelia sp. BU AG58]